MRALPSGHLRNISTGTVIINITVFTVLSLLLCPPLHDARIILVLIFGGKKKKKNPLTPPFAPCTDPPPLYRSLRQPHGSRVNSHCSSPRGDTGQSDIMVTDQRESTPPPPTPTPLHGSALCPLPARSPSLLHHYPPHSLGLTALATARMHGTPTGCLGLRAHSTGRSPALCHLV